MKKLKTPILIIGAGAAGLRAALAIDDQHIDCIVASKGLQGKAHSLEAEGGINAALRNDSWQLHFEDTMRGGDFRNQSELVALLCKRAPDAIKYLQKLGLHFSLNSSGEIDQRAIGGHSVNRCCYSADRIGAEILLTLTEECRRREIHFLDEILITRILTNGNRVIGALGIEKKTGDFLLLLCKAIILATGGIGQLFKFTSNAAEGTGDGLILAQEIGATLKDLEFIQFHPTGLAVGRKPGILISEANRGIGGHLLSFDGKNYRRFVNELDCRDVVARAIWEEIQQGNQVFLDLTHLEPAFLEDQVPDTIRQIRELSGLDLMKGRIPITPTAHFHMGGIKIDPKSNQAYPGLFPCGEVMAGVHGSNRLGGNSLLETQVFGERAGEKAVDFISDLQFLEPDQLEIEKEIERLKLIRTVSNSNEILAQLKEIMWQQVGIVRERKGLEQALTQVINLLPKIDFQPEKKFETTPSPNWYNSIELLNMISLAILIIQSAIENPISSGAHCIKED